MDLYTLGVRAGNAQTDRLTAEREYREHPGLLTGLRLAWARWTERRHSARLDAAKAARMDCWMREGSKL